MPVNVNFETLTDGHQPICRGMCTGCDKVVDIKWNGRITELKNAKRKCLELMDGTCEREPAPRHKDRKVPHDMELFYEHIDGKLYLVGLHEEIVHGVWGKVTKDAKLVLRYPGEKRKMLAQTFVNWLAGIGYKNAVIEDESEVAAPPY